MQTSLFDYNLPPELIAQASISPRDHARLLIADPNHESLTDQHVYDLPSLLRQGDVLIFNDSKVFKARLHATVGVRSFEIFLLHPHATHEWTCLAKPTKRLRIGDILSFSDDFSASLIEKRSDGTCVIRFNRETEDVFSFADTHGEIPTPPYVHTKVHDQSNYQTVYAKERGSVAAPTAGFHFTESLLSTLDQMGVQRAFVTLHVGLGTFRPMKSDSLESHVMHQEWAHVPQETVDLILTAQQEGRRVIVVGTTAMRALESAAASGTLQTYSGFTSLFITPGYHFRVADGLITNFHLPKSTLLVLVSAFAGREFVLRAYQHAIEHAYRFYSFGDAMLVWRASL